MKRIRVLRSRVEEVDRLILKLLACRRTLSVEIGRVKKSNGLSILDITQMKRVLRRNRERGLMLGLPPLLVRQVFVAVHEDSIRIQSKGGQQCRQKQKV